MTPEQKQIAIAEFDGISIEEYRMEEGCINTSALPPYLTSRDAICGAVAKLSDAEFAMWIEHLKDILHCGSWEFDCLTIKEKKDILLATPAQLADALLLTLGYEL